MMLLLLTIMFSCVDAQNGLKLLSASKLLVSEMLE